MGLLITTGTVHRISTIWSSCPQTLSHQRCRQQPRILSKAFLHLIPAVEISKQAHWQQASAQPVSAFRQTHRNQSARYLALKQFRDLRTLNRNCSSAQTRDSQLVHCQPGIFGHQSLWPRSCSSRPVKGQRPSAKAATPWAGQLAHDKGPA